MPFYQNSPTNLHPHPFLNKIEKIKNKKIKNSSIKSNDINVIIATFYEKYFFQFLWLDNPIQSHDGKGVASP